MAKKCLLSLLLACLMPFEIFHGTVLAAETGSPFKDVKTSDWFYNAVRYVYGHELMSGTEDDNFSPKEATTRGMMVTILYNMEGRPAAGVPSFTDVPAGEWYAGPVAWAAENGIASGYGDGRFGPEEPITREQMATILYQYARYKQYDMAVTGNVSYFTDGSKASGYAAIPFGWAIGKGLVNGCGNDLLDPLANAERAHVAAVMKSFCERVADGTAEKTLFNIDPSKVVSVIVENGDSKLTKTTITDREQIEDLVELVNGFTYTSSKKVPPMDGCGYHISFKTNSGGVGLGFLPNRVILNDMDGEPGASIHYYGKAGYFDTLVELADNATEPL